MFKEYVRDGWNLSAVLISSVILVPIISIFFYLFYPSDGIWSHLVATVLQDYIVNSIIIVAFVAITTVIVGVSTAWFVTMYNFPFRRYFEWLLVLPLAIPSYALSYIYPELLGVGGILSTSLNNIIGTNNLYFNFFSLQGAIFVFTFSLFPYVYLLSRLSFLAQSNTYYNLARVSGKNTWYIFRKITIPLSRPAIVGGIVLVSMENLADYGVVDYLGVNTFTRGIFRTWFNLGDHSSAAKLASMLLLTVGIIISIERASRGDSKYTNLIRGHKNIARQNLKTLHSRIIFFICCIPLVLGFIIPFISLFLFSIKSLSNWKGMEFLKLIISSFGLSFFAATVSIFFAIIIVYAMRLNPKLVTPFTRMASLGYSIPGAVAAVGILGPLIWIDNYIDSLSYKVFGISTGLIFTGTWIALIFAYVVRFLALAIQSIENAFIKIPKSIDYAARSLGSTKWRVLTNIHFKLITVGISTGSLIIFVDVLKELPATMILRPFGLNTLAIRAHELASDERLVDASLPLITIVLVCLLPIVLMLKSFSIYKEK